jgi:hypothetical protein
MLDALVDSTGDGRAAELPDSCASCARLALTVADLTRRLEHLESGQAVIVATLPADGLPLPIEPLFDLDAAADLIPMTRDALRGFLAHHPLGRAMRPRYRHLRNQRYCRIRMLLASEIQTIRAHYIRSRSRAA